MFPGAENAQTSYANPVGNASRRARSCRCKIKLDLFEVNLVFQECRRKRHLSTNETRFPGFRGAASHYHDATRSRAMSCGGFIAPSAESPDWKRTTGSLHGQKSLDGDSVSPQWIRIRTCLQHTGYRRFAASDACIGPFKDILSPFRSSDDCVAAQSPTFEHRRVAGLRASTLRLGSSTPGWRFRYLLREICF